MWETSITPTEDSVLVLDNMANTKVSLSIDGKIVLQRGTGIIPLGPLYGEGQGLGQRRMAGKPPFGVSNDACVRDRAAQINSDTFRSGKNPAPDEENKFLPKSNLESMADQIAEERKFLPGGFFLPSAQIQDEARPVGEEIRALLLEHGGRNAVLDKEVI